MSEPIDSSPTRKTKNRGMQKMGNSHKLDISTRNELL
jgi:hypothetical protein